MTPLPSPAPVLQGSRRSHPLDVAVVLAKFAGGCRLRVLEPILPGAAPRPQPAEPLLRLGVRKAGRPRKRARSRGAPRGSQAAWGARRHWRPHQARGGFPRAIVRQRQPSVGRTGHVQLRHQPHSRHCGRFRLSRLPSGRIKSHALQQPAPHRRRELHGRVHRQDESGRAGLRAAVSPRRFHQWRATAQALRGRHQHGLRPAVRARWLGPCCQVWWDTRRAVARLRHVHRRCALRSCRSLPISW